MSIFSHTTIKDFTHLVDRCKRYFPNINYDTAIDGADQMVKIHSGKAHAANHNNIVAVLEKRWYDSLKTGEPDYSVYNDPYYICDIWACWACYSKRSLLALKADNSLIKCSVIDYINSKGTGTIVDLGCGFGFTTLGLKELFPRSTVYGTNIETSYQYKVAKEIVDKTDDVSIVPDFTDLKNVHVAFASEYFEHFERPLEHLEQIVKSCSPKFFITANGFNGHAIGHFNTYKHLSKTYDNRTMSKLFHRAMKIFGYKKLETKIWNSRPAVWERILVKR